ncbi:Transcriptional regulatory protein ZraR [Caulifigura coniformis]|uniref:DNA-binding transcriptional regulator NtrC n=1 Tax=Caulifigura coniformis TaxID=2527983 RepID=A0A517SI10_9PLAN|nr:sigma-54 dependent transcriptional regulator [Caulifigura coniformis]QDT55759.1 Transcriptional regulatory protein ZraR [Caulifigura coniformis]
MASILVIDDEVRHCESLRAFLEQAGHDVAVAGSAEHGLELAVDTPFDVILLDIRLPGIDGLTAISQFRASAPEVPIIVMTAFGTLDTAVAAVREGVFEYLVKPFSLKDLKSVLQRAFDSHRFQSKEENEAPDRGSSPVVVGRCPQIQRIFNRIALVAASDIPVLLTGESGTGKEVMARAIHRYSNRHDKRFLPVFLAALSPNLIESELFGHVRGAFTGAEVDRSGLFEQAAGGTVLLDELGDIPDSLQVKLLRAIEQKEVTRVGEDKPRPIDVRFIAATNKSIPGLIAKGQFREDLFYRLSAYHIELPPLRERRDDIPDLAQHFLQRVASVTRSPGFTTTALAELESRPWQGNIRELRNAVEHAAIAARGSAIAVEHLPAPLTRSPSGNAVDDLHGPISRWIDRQLENLDPLTDRAKLHDALLSEVEPMLFDLTLARCRQNHAAAARVLGLDPKTLRVKLSAARGRSSPQ